MLLSGRNSKSKLQRSKLRESEWLPAKPSWCRKWNLYCCGCGRKLSTGRTQSTAHWPESHWEPEIISAEIKSQIQFLKWEEKTLWLFLWYGVDLNWSSWTESWLVCAICSWQSGDVFYLHNETVIGTIFFLSLFPNGKLTENRVVCRFHYNNSPQLLFAFCSICSLNHYCGPHLSSFIYKLWRRELPCSLKFMPSPWWLTQLL